MVIQVVCWVKLPEQMRLFSIFCENMDPDKWDTNSVVSGHLKSTGIPRVDGLSTGPPDLGCHMMHHCMSIPCHIYDECYMDNSTYAYHQCIMNNYINKHIMSIQYFIHVNISCTHISKSTYNVSFHIVQQHLHNQAIIDQRIVLNSIKKLVP